MQNLFPSAVIVLVLAGKSCILMKGKANSFFCSLQTMFYLPLPFSFLFSLLLHNFPSSMFLFPLPLFYYFPSSFLNSLPLHNISLSSPPPQSFFSPPSQFLLFSLLNLDFPPPPQFYYFPSSTFTSSFILYIFPSTNTSTSY